MSNNNNPAFDEGSFEPFENEWSDEMGAFAFESALCGDQIQQSETRIRDADELPFLRPSLRREMVVGFAAIDRRREWRRRGVLGTAIVLALMPLWWLCQAWPESAVAQHIPFELRDRSTPTSIDEASFQALPAPIVEAVQDGDEFELAAAFAGVRQLHSANLPTRPQ